MSARQEEVSTSTDAKPADAKRADADAAEALARPARAGVTWEAICKLAALAPPERGATTRANLAGQAVMAAGKRPPVDEIARRIRAYLAETPPAIEGKGGDNHTFYVCGRVVRGFDRTPDEALPLMDEWNARCVPPWQPDKLHRKLCEAAKQPGPRGWLINAKADPGKDDDAPPARITNFFTEEVSEGDTMKERKRAVPEKAILAHVHNITEGWPKKLGGENGKLFRSKTGTDGRKRVQLLNNRDQFFAYLSEITSGGGNTRGVRWSTAGDTLATKSEFYAFATLHAEEVAAVEEYPHYPPIPGHLYLNARDVAPPAGPPSADSPFTKLLSYFRPASTEDYALIRAAFLTLVWGGPGGARPMFMITTPEGTKRAGRGAGKSTLAILASELVGSYMELGQGEDFPDFKTRLLSPDGRTKRVVLIDNLKSTKFSWGEFESFITGKVVSGRELFVGNGTRPNTLTTFLTVNGAALSKDLARRTVTIQIKPHEGDTKGWHSEVTAFIESNRQAILDDMIRGLMGPRNPISEGKSFTWERWESEVLSLLPNPDGLIDLILSRQAGADEDQSEADDLRAKIVEEVSFALTASDDAETRTVFISSQRMAEMLAKVTGNGKHSEPRSATRYVLTLGVERLERYGMTGRRGFVWRGNKAPENGNVEFYIE
jgi:hypothetical protein